MYFSFQTFNPVMYLVMISFQTLNLVLILTIWKIQQPDLSLTHQDYFCQTESLKKNCFSLQCAFSQIIFKLLNY